MRPDMRKVIIERPRTKPSFKYKTHRRTLNQRDPESLSITEGMTKPYRHDRKEQTDLLGPISRWLDKQVGRPWDDVWSEVCSSGDNRSVVSKHLRQHVRGYVSITKKRNGLKTWCKFWVDNNGVLQREEERFRRWNTPKPFEEELQEGLFWLNNSWTGPRYAIVRLSSCQWVFAVCHDTWTNPTAPAYPWIDWQSAWVDKITKRSYREFKKDFSFTPGWRASEIRYLTREEKELIGIR